MNDTSKTGRQNHITIVDGARGACALYVLVAHLEGVYHLKQLVPEWRYLIAIFTNYGHQAVILFFLLSGFSIHYSSLLRNLSTREGLNHYYFLRFRRIYPIFFCAVVLTLLLSALGCVFKIGDYCSEIDGLSFVYVLQTFLFATDRSYIAGAIAPVLPSNSPLWSLSYEVIYYLVYPLFWLICKRFGNGMGLLAGFAISLIAIVFAKLYYPNHLLNVLSLYFLWCLGAWAAWCRWEGRLLSWPAGVHFLIGYALAQAVWVFEFSGLTVFYNWLWGSLFFSSITFFLLKRDLSESGRVEKVVLLAALILGLATIVLASTKLALAPDWEFFYIKVVATALLYMGFVILASIRSPDRILRALLWPFAALGSISYAMYVFHFPVIRFVAAIESMLIASSFLGLCITIIAVLSLAYMFEIRWQPIFNRRLGKLWKTTSYSRRSEVTSDA